MSATSAPIQIAGNFLGNLVRRRGLIMNLVARDFKQRYIGSSMGWLWAIVHPIVLLVSYTFVFAIIFKVRLGPEAGTPHFAIFLFAGILPWLLFQETVQRSANSMVDYSNLITKSVFPAELIPISIFLSNVLNHLLGILILVAVVAGLTQKLSGLVVLLPVYILFLGMFTLGVSWLVSSLNVFLRDTAQALTIALTFWFWFTPIFFTADRIPTQLRFLAQINPLAGVVSAYRSCILSASAPSAADMAWLALISGATFVAGGLFFRHSKRAFGDVL
ncbi:MAG: ABC transporter permease [Acidobacteria bacterium]|nr:ABC transporter permease [Acidobacteriota bacterium]